MYVIAQIAGGCAGAVVANLMFDLPAVTLSTHDRSSAGVLLGEVVATFGLLLVILGVVRSGRSSFVAFAVGGYIAAAYWFTSSTSFANPAVTIARTLTNTFAGISPSSVPGVHRRAGPRRDRGDRVLRLPRGRERGSGAMTDSPRPLPLRAQRGAFADGARMVRGPRGRTSRGSVGRLRASGRSQSRCRRSDGRGRHRHRGERRRAGGPTSICTRPTS